MLKLENILGGYIHESMVLQGIDLKIAKGEVVGIIGLNGCGKSTLGKAVMNILPHRQGKVWLDGNDVSLLPVHRLQQEGISMVLQGGRVFPQMTVMEHLHLVGNTKTDLEIKNKLKYIDEQFGLNLFSGNSSLNRKGSYLSGGEKQQLALAMALITMPKLLILDEISAGLSPINLDQIELIIENIKQLKTIGVMLIEQNIRLATTLSDRLLLLERGIIDKEFINDGTFSLNSLNENIFN